MSKLTNFDKVRDKFMQIWADPLDTRTEFEVAKDLGVDASVLVKMRSEADFYEPARELFQKSFRASIIPIMKNLIRQAERHKSLGATKVLLEMLGMIEGRGTKINVMNVGGGGGGGPNLSELTDDELNLEIHRLLTETLHTDVSLDDGRVTPSGEVLTVEVIEEKRKTAPAPKRDSIKLPTFPEPVGRGVEPESEEGQALLLPAGEAEEDGS